MVIVLVEWTIKPFEKTLAQLYGYLGRTLVRHRASRRDHVRIG